MSWPITLWITTTKINKFFLLLLLFSFNAYALEQDKKMHFVSGSLVFLTSKVVINQSRYIPAVLGCSSGVAKEFYDDFSKSGTVDINDFYYTCAGSILTSFFFEKK